MRPTDDEPVELIIERVMAGEAGEAEIARLTTWRRESSANEAEYRHHVRLIAAVRSLRSSRAAAPPPPTAAEVIARAGWLR